MLNSSTYKKLLRYSAQGAIVYLLFRYLPNNKMQPSDALLVTMTIILATIMLENLYYMYIRKILYKPPSQETSLPAPVESCSPSTCKTGAIEPFSDGDDNDEEVEEVEDEEEHEDDVPHIPETVPAPASIPKDPVKPQTTKPAENKEGCNCSGHKHSVGCSSHAMVDLVNEKMNGMLQDMLMTAMMNGLTMQNNKMNKRSRRGGDDDEDDEDDDFDEDLDADDWGSGGEDWDDEEDGGFDDEDDEDDDDEDDESGRKITNQKLTRARRNKIKQNAKKGVNNMSDAERTKLWNKYSSMKNVPFIKNGRFVSLTPAQMKQMKFTPHEYMMYQTAKALSARIKGVDSTMPKPWIKNGQFNTLTSEQLKKLSKKQLVLYNRAFKKKNANKPWYNKKGQFRTLTSSQLSKLSARDRNMYKMAHSLNNQTDATTPWISHGKFSELTQTELASLSSEQQRKYINALAVSKGLGSGSINNKSSSSSQMYNADGSGIRDSTRTDMGYNDYGFVPVPDGYKSKDYEYGYSFLPPEKWYPQPPRAPKCVADKKCPVCPVMTAGAPIDVKEWSASNNVLPEDSINIDYIKNRLNKKN